MSDKNLVDWVEIYTDAHGELRWSAMSANGRNVANSGEGYTSEGHLLANVETLFPGVEIRRPKEET